VFKKRNLKFSQSNRFMPAVAFCEDFKFFFELYIKKDDYPQYAVNLFNHGTLNFCFFSEKF